MAFDPDPENAQLGNNSMRSLTTGATSAGRTAACLRGYGVPRLNGQAPFHAIGGAELRSASEDEIRPAVASAAGPCAVAEERKRQIRDLLADSDVFGALADDDLDRLIGQGRTATYPGGAIVFRKGDPAENLMIVLCGRIRLSSASWHGREVLFDFIGPGRCFGEGALIDRATRKLEAAAARPSLVFALRRRDVLACLESHPEVAVRIIRVLCERLGRAMEMYEDRTQLGLSSRTARALLRLAGEYGSREGNVVRIGLKISQGEIAALVGATREKVNRQLCAWCRSGILAVDEGHLTIHRPAALHSLAEER
jgi:CRP-like cAMP-binding protein